MDILRATSAQEEEWACGACLQSSCSREGIFQSNVGSRRIPTRRIYIQSSCSRKKTVRRNFSLKKEVQLFLKINSEQCGLEKNTGSPSFLFTAFSYKSGIRNKGLTIRCLFYFASRIITNERKVLITGS